MRDSFTRQVEDDGFSGLSGITVSTIREKVANMKKELCERELDRELSPAERVIRDFIFQLDDRTTLLGPALERSISGLCVLQEYLQNSQAFLSASKHMDANVAIEDTRKTADFFARCFQEESWAAMQGVLTFIDDLRRGHLDNSWDNGPAGM